MEESLITLNKIIQKHKKNGKLNAEDKKTAQDNLEHILMITDSRSNSFDIILSLPAEISCAAISNIWNKFSDKEKDEFINHISTDKQFNTTAGNNRKTDLIKKLTSISPNHGLTLLISLAHQLTASGSKSPTTAMIKKYKKTLIDDKDLLKILLTQSTTSIKDISLITTLILFAFSEGYKLLKNDQSVTENYNMEVEYLNWLKAYSNSIEIPAKPLKDLSKELLYWPEKVQRECYDMGLIKEIHLKNESHVIQKEAEKQSIEKTQETNTDTLEKSKSILPDAATVVSASPKRPPFGSDSIQKEHDVLLQIENIGREIKHLVNKYRDTENVLSITKQKLFNRENELLEIKKYLQIKEQDIRDYLETISKLEKNVESKQAYIMELKETINSKEIEFKKMESDLLNLIDNESEQKTQHLRNRIGNALKTDYEQLMKVKDTEMNIELGEALRSRMETLFLTLEREKILFKQR